MVREKMTERKWFTRDEKIFILDKSNGKCCRCGKSLNIGDGFTVEHVIPISKGGTNEPRNIVALCDKCNSEKGNNIVLPYLYFKYLKDEYLEEVGEMYADYCMNVDWFTLNNFCLMDKHLLLGTRPGALLGHNKKGKGKKMCMARMAPILCPLSKAEYKDLDEVYQLCMKYNRKYGLTTDADQVKSYITGLFLKGVIYIVRNGSKELVAVIPIALLKTFVHVNDKGDIGEVCAINLLNIMCLYNKDYYIEVLNDALSSIFCSLCTLQLLGVGVPIVSTYLERDEIAYWTNVCVYNNSVKMGKKALDDEGYMRRECLVTSADDREKYLEEEDIPLGERFLRFSEALLDKAHVTMDDILERDRV